MTEINGVMIYVAIIVNALFTGIGTALGVYLANNHLIKKTKNLIKKLRRGK